MADNKPGPKSLDWEAFCAALRAVTEARVPHMVVGSVAASFYGLGRSTHDVDLVVAVSISDVPQLVKVLEPDFYVDAESVAEAIRRRDMFNAIHYEGGFKIDFWILADDEFSTTQFQRRQCINVEGINACIATVEDTILSKLKWYKMGHSERQWSDIKEVITVNVDVLDLAYLKRWAGQLGVETELESLLKEQ